MQVFTGVSVMFVLMAIVPTLTFLTDLGFRWVAGIQIFQVYTMNTAGILAVSLGSLADQFNNPCIGREFINFKDQTISEQMKIDHRNRMW